MSELAILQMLYSRHSTSAMGQRRAARKALAEMKRDRDWIAGVDDSSLDFLATEISQQMMQELAKRWAPRMEYPTSSNLAALAESLHLQAAVAALDA